MATFLGAALTGFCIALIVGMLTALWLDARWRRQERDHEMQARARMAAAMQRLAAPSTKDDRS